MCCGFQERNIYLPLAENGSALYFVISDLAKINNMYRFSLAAFLRLFQRSLSDARQVKDKGFHYVYKPIQNTAIFKTVKQDNFRMKKCDIFLIFALKHRLWVLVRTTSMRR